MQLSHLLVQLVMLAAAVLSFLSALSYLRFRTINGLWGGAFLTTLGIELALYSILWSADLGAVNPVLYGLQIAAFFLIHPFWLFYVDTFSDHRPPIDSRLSFLVFCLPLLGLGALLIPRLSGANLPIESWLSLATVFGNESMIRPWATLFIGYFSLLVLLAAFRILQLFLRLKSWSDKRLFVPMFIGSLVVIASSALEFSGNNFLAPVSILQAALGAIGLTSFFYIRIYKFGGILPVGHESAFAMMRDGSILLDAKNTVVDLNPRAERFLDRRKRQCINRPVAAILPEAARLIETQPAEDYLVMEIPQDGRGTLTELSVTRFSGINHTTTGRLVTIRDITERDRLETTLVERNQWMEQSNNLLQALAEANLAMQSNNDPGAIFSGLQDFMARVDLDYFVALTRPESGELAIEYFSLKPVLVERFEKASGFRAKGYVFRREDAAELYSYLDDDRRDFFLTDFQVKNGDPGLRSILLEVAYRFAGIEADMPFAIFKLVAGSHKIGLMGMWGRGLQVRNLNPLRIFTGRVAWAIERIQLYQRDQARAFELERSNQLLTALANVSAQMGKSTESAAALEVLGRQLEEIGLHCLLGYMDPAQENLVFRFVSFEHGPQRLGKYLPGSHFVGYRHPRRNWSSEDDISGGVPVWHTHVFDLFTRLFPMIPEHAMRAAMKEADVTDEDRLCILPLIVDGKVTGTLPIWGKHIREHDTPGLVVFAHQVAEFLRKTEVYEKEAARAANLARSNQIIFALSNVAASLETTTNLMEVYETLGSEMRKVNLNCLVGTLEPGEQFIKIEYLSVSDQISALAEKVGVHWPDQIRIPRRLWPSEITVTKRVPYWDADPVGSVCKVFPLLPRVIFVKNFEMAGMSANDQICYLPMVIEDEVIGILGVWGHDLKDDDIPGLNVFSNQVAAAIRNTTLYHQAQEELFIRREAEAKIKAALTEKEVLLKEVHHRVKNNLQVITSLLSLQMAQFNDSACAEVLRESQNRVRAMALIHEKLYQTPDLARINFSSYIQSLASFLAQTYRGDRGRVSIRMDVSDILLDLDTAIPCGLIINELVSNAFKYAFPDDQTGSISISCRENQGGHYLLSVADTGIGLPASVDPWNSTTLGLKLVTSLVRQINGQMTVDSGHGTHFDIRFTRSKE